MKKSQAISGHFWDLTTKRQVNKADLTRIVIKMIDFLPVEATVTSLLEAQKQADQALFNGKYRNIIEANWAERGF